MHGTCPKINNMAQSTVNGYTIVRGVSSFENVLHQRTHGMHVHISVGSVWPERQVELKSDVCLEEMNECNKAKQNEAK